MSSASSPASSGTCAGGTVSPAPTRTSWLVLYYDYCANGVADVDFVFE
jgi:hypothetical protein